MADASPAGGTESLAVTVSDCAWARGRGPQCDIGAVEFNALLPNCATAVPTAGCTVNFKANQVCQGSGQGDLIVGTPGADVILAGGGGDIVLAGGGVNIVCGGAGNDLLLGGISSDGLDGEGGFDVVNGSLGRDGCVGEVRTLCEQ